VQVTFINIKSVQIYSITGNTQLLESNKICRNIKCNTCNQRRQQK